MSDKTGRTRDKRIRTGSIALRIALGSAFFLLLAFFIIDVAVILIETWPELREGFGGRTNGLPGPETVQNWFTACRDVFLTRRFDLLLKVEGAVILNNVAGSDNVNYGYDAAGDKYGDMLEFGIVDPTKVCRSALENAASVASMVLTTESLVADVPEKNPPMPAAPDMGGMY